MESKPQVKKASKKKAVAEPASDEVVVLVKKLQQQLVYLEKKIDILIANKPERSFNRDNRFSKPKRFGGSPRRYESHDGGRPSAGTGERKFSRPTAGGGGFDRFRGRSQGASRSEKRPFRPKRRDSRN